MYWKLLYICIIIIYKTKIMATLQDIYLSQESFDKALDDCLTIIKYPSKSKPYYTCEYISTALYKKNVNIYISN